MALMRVYLRRRLRRERVFRDRSNPLDTDDDEHIILKFRLPRRTIFMIIDLIRNDIEPATQRSHAIPATLQVMVSLRYLATGTLYSPLCDSFGISKSSTSRIIKKVTAAIVRRIREFIFFDMNQLNRSSAEFNNIANFPNVFGCVDGSQFAIKAPSNNEFVYVNRKGFHSVNGQLVCDSNLIFTDINIRYPGSTHDAFIFQFSELSRRFQNLEFPEGWLLGDSGYSNLPYLLTPFTNPETPGERAYNRSHRRTRVKIECSIGVLKSRFLCLSRKISGPLLFSPSIACKIIACCCCLHNIARRLGLPDPNIIEDDENENDADQDRILLNTGAQTRARLVNNRFS